MSPKNMAASVHARLADIARKTGRPFQELLQYYAMERFLYRLSKSPHAARFVLKGALMLRVWDAPMARPTKDIDLLGARAFFIACEVKPHPRPVLKVGHTRRRLPRKARRSRAGVARPAQTARRLGHRGDRLLRYLWHGH